MDDEETAKIVSHIISVLKSDKSLFDEREIEVLAELAEIEMKTPGAFAAWAKVHNVMGSIGFLGASLKSVLVWFIGLAVAWGTFKGYLSSLLFDLMKGGS